MKPSLQDDKKIKYLAVLLTLMVCTTRLSMAAGQVFMALSVLTGLILTFKYRQELVVPQGLQGYFKAVGIFFLSTLPSVFFAGDMLIGLKAFLDVWLYRFLAFVLIILFIKQRNYLVKMLGVFLIVTNIDCLVAVVQLVLRIDGANRGWGFGSNVLTLAGVMVMLFPIVLVIFYDERFDIWLKKIATCSIGCIILGLLANKSRGSWLTLLVTTPIAALRYIMQNRTRIFSWIIFIVVLSSFFAYTPTYIQRWNSITNTTTDHSNADRIWVWKSACNMIRDHPVIGVGLNQFRSVYRAHYKFKQETQDLVHAHNNFVQVTAENGVIGCMGFLYFLGYFLVRSVKNWRQGKNPYDILVFTTVLGYLCLFGQIEYTLDNSSGMRIFWFLLAILLQLKRLGFEEKVVN